MVNHFDNPLKSYHYKQKISSFKRSNSENIVNSIYRLLQYVDKAFKNPNNPDDTDYKVLRLKTLDDRWSLAKHVTLPTPIDDRITPEELIHGFQHWKERKTTSPSGRHLGLYRILTQPNHPEEDEDITNDIAKMLASILNICLTHNVTLKRWRKANSVLIQKNGILCNLFMVCNQVKPSQCG